MKVLLACAASRPQHDVISERTNVAIYPYSVPSLALIFSATFLPSQASGNVLLLAGAFSAD